MSKISQKTFQKLAENTLGILYEHYPRAYSTTALANELVRDNEFVLKILLFLEKNGYVERKGKKWQRWILTKQAKEKYDVI
ncbi:hypothetical protein HUU53_00365 [Candidatus Micrarchaeota archaeon]|nr:hypothetical protein [Candidatus Micrarchaeota archaeon]